MRRPVAHSHFEVQTTEKGGNAPYLRLDITQVAFLQRESRIGSKFINICDKKCLHNHNFRIIVVALYEPCRFFGEGGIR